MTATSQFRSRRVDRELVTDISREVIFQNLKLDKIFGKVDTPFGCLDLVDRIGIHSTARNCIASPNQFNAQYYSVLQLTPSSLPHVKQGKYLMENRFLLGFCSNDGKKMLIRISPNGHGHELVSLTILSTRAKLDSSGELDAAISGIDVNYKGCENCGARGIVECYSCEQISCCDPQDTKFKCGSCQKVGVLDLPAPLSVKGWGG